MTRSTHRKIDKVIGEVQRLPRRARKALLLAETRASAAGSVVGKEGIAHSAGKARKSRENRKLKVSVNGIFPPKRDLASLSHLIRLLKS